MGSYSVVLVQMFCFFLYFLEGWSSVLVKDFNLRFKGLVTALDMWNFFVMASFLSMHAEPTVCFSHIVLLPSG